MSVVQFDEYFPFDPGTPGAATANATRWRKMGQLWAPDGVRAGFLNQLAATWQTVGTSVAVQSGAVFIHGYYAELQATHNIAISGSGNGTIVAQVSMATNNELIQLVYRDTVVDYGSNPASSYQQDADPSPGQIWEIPLWLITGGNTLTDLRTMVSGGSGLTWFGHLDAAQLITNGQTSPLTMAQFLVARVSYAGFAKIEGTALIAFQDLSTATTAACQLSYQQGVAGQAQVVPATPLRPGFTALGAALAGQTFSMPVTLSGVIPVTQGRKTAGWLVSVTGASVQISNMTLSMRLISVPPSA